VPFCGTDECSLLPPSGGEVEMKGDSTKVTQLLGLIDEFDRGFDIVEPERN
jgi:alkyl sulfatase BDS1-like metallo-beta-lactamase superfamily hydrolase